VAGNLGKAIKFARSPQGRKVLMEAIRVARSEEGKKLIAQARKVATTPEGKRLLAQAREQAKVRIPEVVPAISLALLVANLCPLSPLGVPRGLLSRVC